MYLISTVVILGLAVLVVLSMYSLNKVRNMHLLMYSMKDQQIQEQAQQYQQLAALAALHTDLRLSKSLPATRGWAASPDFLLELSSHAQAAEPSVVVECSSGTSTVVLARCMQLNGRGKVYSLEHDPEYAEKTRQQLARHELSAYAEVLDAPLRMQRINGVERNWYSYDVLPAALQIDMLVIDGPPEAIGRQARYPAGPALFPQLAAGATVLLDDADRPDETAIVQQWLHEFPVLKASKRYCEKAVPY